MQFINSQQRIDITDIRNFLCRTYDNFSISESSIRRLLKHEIKAKYVHLLHLYADKNTQKTKTFRKYVAKFIVKCYANNDNFIAIDETSFSTVHKKSRH